MILSFALHTTFFQPVPRMRGDDPSHYHNHYRCKVVAGKPDTKVGGYNPEIIRERISEVAEPIQLDQEDKSHRSSNSERVFP